MASSRSRVSEVTTSYKHLFSRFIAHGGGRLHFAAHSHHPWPDETRQAHIDAWDFAAEFLDDKWDRVFGDLVPRVQAHVARELGLSRPNRIAFAPNTHEFITRLISSFPHDAPVRILTTDSEFHSFTRQCTRWSEVGRVHLEVVPTEPFETFDDRFLEAAEGSFDVVFASQVFFNSGFVFERFRELTERVPERETLIVIDGYHGFMALPTDLASVEDRIFYIAGGYKYAMSGEGVCFLHCPDGYAPRPVNTGWFATFEDLESANGHGSRVRYSSTGMRFWGATYDPTPLYRMCAVFDVLDRFGLSTETIHAHVRSLQEQFLAHLPRIGSEDLALDRLVPGRSFVERGHFLTFRTEAAGEVHHRIRLQDVVSDYRGDKFRLGFGIYHDPEDVDDLAHRIRVALK